MQSVIENSGNKINNMIYKKKKNCRDCSSKLTSTETAVQDFRAQRQLTFVSCPVNITAPTM